MRSVKDISHDFIISFRQAKEQKAVFLKLNEISVYFLREISDQTKKRKPKTPKDIIRIVDNSLNRWEAFTRRTHTLLRQITGKPQYVVKKEGLKNILDMHMPEVMKMYDVYKAKQQMEIKDGNNS